MPTKEETTKDKPAKPSRSGKYFYGLGRRKSSIAQVRLYPHTRTPKESKLPTGQASSVQGKQKGKGEILVNDALFSDYFNFPTWQQTVQAPLTETNLADKFDAVVKVTGGGKPGQTEAIRLGIARALLEFDKDLRPALKAKGYLSRDQRVKERKKPGLKGARRSPQWSKR